MSSSRTRITVIAGVFGAGLCVVLLHLWLLMVRDQEVWARRSYENRWAFRSVPSRRGALYDRNGALLAYDEPTTQVSIYYRQFRRWNVVGAAVHGATAWANSSTAADVPTYGYGSGDADFGPRRAGRDLLSVPVAALRAGTMEGQLLSELRHTARVVLAGCSGLPLREVGRALRDAWERGAPLGVGDVLPAIPRGELLEAYEQRVAALERFADELWQAQVAGAQRVRQDPEDLTGLFATLDLMRRRSLMQQRGRRTDDEGRDVPGAYLEDVRRVCAADVPFALGAGLRLDRERFVGIDVQPAVRRVRTIAPDTSFDWLLGIVRPVDRMHTPTGKVVTESGEERDYVSWIDRFLEQRMPDEWLDRLVPEGMADDERTRLAMLESARQRYAYEMMVRERRGLDGLERAHNDELIGRLGMRFVEHDSRYREQVLWSHLQVEPGQPVEVTFDLQLQQLAEAAVRRAAADFAALRGSEESRQRVQAALCVLDAHTGDVLAFAGAPLRDDEVESRGRAALVPGLRWQGNGSIGSVAKPFVLLEHLAAARDGQPHTPVRDMERCARTWAYEHRWGTTMFTCDHAHGEEGRDPVRAIAESCNIFFYQAAFGIGETGVNRALRRFGLLPPGEMAELAAAWQPSSAALWTAPPSVDRNRTYPYRAIGYGVAASVAHVARAYAALATGTLREFGTRLGEQRPGVALDRFHDLLPTVRRGLAECVASGTARQQRYPELAVFTELGVHGKTGTAEISTTRGDNNAWFAGYLPWTSESGVQLAFAGVVYWVPSKTYGATAAGAMLAELFENVKRHPGLRRRYL